MNPVATVMVACTLAACVTASPRPPAAAPLDDEGELLVQLSIEDGDTLGLEFDVASLAAIRSDGVEVPLQLATDGAVAPGQAPFRVIASARVEPASFTGLKIAFARAELRRAPRSVALVLPETPVIVTAPFGVPRRSGVLLDVVLDGRASVEGHYAFAPVLRAQVPSKTVASLVGLVSEPAQHRLIAFDRRSRALTGVVPTGSGPHGVELDEVNGRIFVALTGDDEIQILDLASFAVLARVRLQPGDAPGELALTADRSQVVVVNTGSNSLSFIETASWTEHSRLELPPGADALLLDDAGHRAYVTHGSTNRVTVVDLPTRSIVRTLLTEERPLRPRLARDGKRLFIAHEGSGYVAVLSVPEFVQLQRVYVGLGVTAIQVDPVTDHLYVASGPDRRLSLYDRFSLMPIERTVLPAPAAELWLDLAEHTLIARLTDRDALLFLDLTTRRPVALVPLPGRPRFIALSGRGR